MTNPDKNNTKGQLSGTNKAWAQTVLRKITDQAAAPANNYAHTLDSVTNHPHKLWAKAVTGMVSYLEEQGVSKIGTHEQMRATILYTLNAADSNKTTPVTAEDKMNVVKLIAEKSGVYDEVRSFRLPGSNGDKSMFDDNTQWPQALDLTLLSMRSIDLSARLGQQKPGPTKP